uniref:Rap guanine nucleotide exchange factor 5-like n=1 Tax=Castor canadensis TaxID=51338 RepID=A0A8B7VPI0_CASCN
MSRSGVGGGFRAQRRCPRAGTSGAGVRSGTVGGPGLQAERLAARPAPEPQSRPLAAWRRRGRRAEASAEERSRGRRSRRQGMRMAVGSVKMQPPCESPALAAAAAVAATDGALRRSPSAHEPDREQAAASLRPRLRDLPALLRSGLTLRRKRSAAGGRTLSRRISNPYLEHTPSQIYGENSSCAGRALRNMIIVQAADLVKDRVNLKGFYRRSCVGSELVDWLLEHCPFVQCRSMAIGVWQLLLDMGIMSSVDQHLYFQDTYVFYQFSSDECSYLYCEFEREEEWQNGVKLLLQLVPLIPARAGICELSHQKIEDSEESSDEILARLTSAVQRELAAVIALKARKS